MKQRKTVEDYLKTIYLLSKTKEVHGAYIAEKLGVSKPTVSIALKSLEKEGYLTRDERRAVRLTETGLEIAEATYERHQTFQALLEDTLSDECRYQVVQSVHGQLREMIEEHKASKEEQPLLLSKGEVRSVLSSCGVAAPHVDAFEAQYDQAFGPEAGLSPRNLVDPKQLEDLHILCELPAAPKSAE